MTWSTGTLPSVYTPEVGWYDEEIPYYDWVTGESTDVSKQIGHFTQMVWTDTTHIGCAETRITRTSLGVDTNYAYSVCRYSPPGNIYSGGSLLIEKVQPLIVQ